MIRSRYPGMSWEKLVKLLMKNYAIIVVSQKWSHIKVKNLKYKSIVPNHKEIAYGTFSSILEQLHIDEDEFLDKL